MDSILVSGGHRIAGTVAVEGAKNSALKLMAASLLAAGTSRIANVPNIKDVDVMSDVLRVLGADVIRVDHAIEIDATRLSGADTPYDLVAKMRASIAVLGPLVTRLGSASVAMPGGCNIGSRKLDLHVGGLQSFGVTVSVEHGFLRAVAPPDGLHAAQISLAFPSVGATENLVMAATLAKGTTVLQNVAREPEIVDLIEFLNTMGARIDGAGTSTLTIEGVDELLPADHTVVGDRIEAATYLIAGALCGGPVTVTGVDPAHLTLVLAKLREAGCDVEAGAHHVTVGLKGRPRPTDVQTLPYPGFPTDIQTQFMALMALAEGDSIITENVFENRFMFADELARMGADVRIEGHHALVRGVKELSGAPVQSTDLRGGASLVLAGMAAQGETIVGDVYHIERGYECFVEKLQSLGAKVSRVSPSW